MPKMPAKTATSRTTRRFLKQSATNWSIIEPDSTLHDDSVAGPKAAFDDSGIALLICDFDIAAFEGPIRDLDEDARRVAGHEQRGGGHDEPGYGGRDESSIGEHPRLEGLVGIVESNARLGAPRVGLEHVADEQHLAAEGLSRIGREAHLHGLVRCDQRGVLFGNI